MDAKNGEKLVWVDLKLPDKMEFFIPAKRNVDKVEKYFNFIYRKDGSRYLHIKTDDCIQSNKICDTTATCPLCFKLTCKQHYIEHCKLCKNIAHPYYIVESILWIDIAYMILKNTSDMKTFRNLLFSHAIFRNVFIKYSSFNDMRTKLKNCMDYKFKISGKRNLNSVKECMALQIRLHSMYPKNSDLQIKEVNSNKEDSNIQDIQEKTQKTYISRYDRKIKKGNRFVCPICLINKDRSKQQKHMATHDTTLPIKCAGHKYICLICFRMVCKVHIDDHISNGCYNGNKNPLVDYMNVYKTILNRQYKNTEKWTEDSWIEALKYDVILARQLPPNKSTTEIIKCIWSINKPLAYELMPKEKKCGYFYILMLKELKIYNTTCDLESLPPKQITNDVLKAWIECPLFNKCNIVLPDNLEDDIYLKIVFKNARNILIIPICKHTIELCSLAVSNDISLVCMCNPDCILKEDAIKYIENYGTGEKCTLLFKKKWPEEFAQAVDIYRNKPKYSKSGLASLVGYGSQDRYLQ